MEFCGIIAEFNPFHNGHAYFLSEAKRLSGKPIICVMSGNFTQRGDPAIASKFDRAKTAIQNGADMVVELPTLYACSNAENFASGAIKILKAMGATQIAFGVENASKDDLLKIADLKVKNSESFQTSFKNEIQNGINFNTALKRSIVSELGDKKTECILNSPNNVLAIEYLTAIKKQNALVQPLLIERTDNGFWSDKPNTKFLGATAIRNLILSGKDVSEFVPSPVSDKVFEKNENFALETLELVTLRNLSAEKLEEFYDYSEGIEYRIKEMADKSNTLQETLENVCSSRYREPRVKKLLLYPLLGVTKDLKTSADKTKPVAKVLAIKKESKFLLSEINKNKISLVVSNHDYENLSSNQKKIFDVDFHASEIYRSIMQNPKNDKKMGTLFV